MSGVCSKGTADIVKEGLENLGTAAMEFFYKIVTRETTGVKETGAVFSLLMRLLSFLFDLDGGYFVSDHVVALWGYFGEALKEDDLPSTVKRHLNKRKRNLTEADLENIKKRIEELLQFVKDNPDRVITKTELKRIQLEQNMIKRDLDVCKMHVTDAETEVKNVEKSVKGLLALYGIGVATVAIGGKKAVCVANVLSAVISKAAGRVACGVIAGATVLICYKLLEKSSSYAKWLTEFKNDTLPKLEQEEREFDLELLKKNLNLLDVAD